jgi:hypothetical protein
LIDSHPDPSSSAITIGGETAVLQLTSRPSPDSAPLLLDGAMYWNKREGRFVYKTRRWRGDYWSDIQDDVAAPYRRRTWFGRWMMGLPDEIYFEEFRWHDETGDHTVSPGCMRSCVCWLLVIVDHVPGDGMAEAIAGTDALSR